MPAKAFFNLPQPSILKDYMLLENNCAKLPEKNPSRLCKSWL